jgi:dsRNA-specific ribonuclease
MPVPLIQEAATVPIHYDSIGRDRLVTLAAFQRLLKFKFRDQTLINRALTHRSYVNEDPRSPGNNERLEFLGDAVLGMVAAARLFTSLGDKTEGDLARIKSFVVSEDTLSELASKLGMDALLLVGKGEERSGGRNKKAILADALEAVFGAAYLDAGFEKTQQLVLSLINPEIEKVLSDRHPRITRPCCRNMHKNGTAVIRNTSSTGRQAPTTTVPTGSRAYSLRKSTDQPAARQKKMRNKLLRLSHMMRYWPPVGSKQRSSVDSGDCK